MLNFAKVIFLLTVLQDPMSTRTHTNAETDNVNRDRPRWVTTSPTNALDPSQCTHFISHLAQKAKLRRRLTCVRPVNNASRSFLARELGLRLPKPLSQAHKPRLVNQGHENTCLLSPQVNSHRPEDSHKNFNASRESGVEKRD